MSDAEARVRELVLDAREAIYNDQDDEGPISKPPEPRLPPNSPGRAFVTCEPKHFARGSVFFDGDAAGFVKKPPVALKDCHFGVNRNVCLLLTAAQEQDFAVPMSQTASLNLIVEDANGWRALLTAFHGAKRFFEEWPLFAVMDPYIRKNQKTGAVTIRVESPLDLHDFTPREWNGPPIVDSLFRKRQEQLRPHTMAELREAATRFFNRGEISKALRCWTLAITYDFANPKLRKEVALCRLNRAAAYLKVERPILARLECHNIDFFKLLDTLDPLQIEKYWFRYVTAQYEEGIKQGDAVGLNKVERKDEHDLLLRKWRKRERTAADGAYDWKQMLANAKQGKSNDVCDYPSLPRAFGDAVNRDLAFSKRLSLVDIPGKGRGLVADKEYECGELVMLATPMSYAKAPDRKSGWSDVTTVNLATEQLAPTSQAQLIRQIYEDTVENYRVFYDLFELHGGPAFPSKPAQRFVPFWNGMAHLRGDSIDAGRVEGVVTHNAFRVRCCSQVFEDEEQSRNAASALYFHPSFFNHSCMPNCTYTWFGQTMVVRTLCKVARNEELTISYVDSAANLIDRRKALRHHFDRGQVCECPLCTVDMAGDYAKRKRLLDAVGPVESLTCAEAETFYAAIEDTYAKTHGRFPLIARLRAELYPLARHIARFVKDAGDRLELELKALCCIFVPDEENLDSRPAHGIICQSVVLSHLLASQLYADADPQSLTDEEIQRRSARVPTMHELASELHSALYGPGLLKARLGEWMAIGGISWHGDTPFDEA